MSCCCAGMSRIQSVRSLASDNKEHFGTAGKITFSIEVLTSSASGGRGPGAF
jgi:hypothetical protein